MATEQEAPAMTDEPGDGRSVAWHTLEREEVGNRLGVEPGTGLSTAEAASRLASVGPNRFAEAEVEPRWRAFVRQYRDPMQIVLLVAGIGSLYPLKELGTGLVLLFLTLFNAVLGLRQEGKAAEAVAKLKAAPDFANVVVLSLEAERRSARRHLECLDLREGSDDLVCDSVGEEIAFGIGAHIRERHHRD